MSRSLGSKWLARIGRDQITLGRRGHLLSESTTPAVPLASVSLDNAGDPLMAVDALTSLLAERASRGWGDSLEVLLEDDWAYHRVIDGDFGKMKAAQRKLLAQAYFVDALTTDQGGWSVSTELQPDGRSLLCCAVNDILRDGLQSAAAAHGVRLSSVQTVLASRMHHWAAKLPEDVLVLVCSLNTVCLALRIDDSWKAIDTWSRTGSIGRELRSRTAALLHRNNPGGPAIEQRFWFENIADAQECAEWSTPGAQALAAPLQAFVAEAA